jgi:hypothetical protein
MRCYLSFGLALAIFSMDTRAHHSLAGIYDTGREITLEGKITQVQFINPHPFVTIEVKAAKGSQKWRIELDNRYELIAIGMTDSTLKKGDQVIVRGSPARDKSQNLYIRKLERPSDGFWYEQFDSTPEISLPKPAR